ncbi:MAG: MopE-related protein [Myxococcota bacterium]|nr:MopE-related protein [Myxococcota bacterium]
MDRDKIIASLRAVLCVLMTLSFLACGNSTSESNSLSQIDEQDSSFRMMAAPDVETPDEPQTRCIDRDGDGYGQFCDRGADCDDGRSASHPGATEQCGDGADNDCDEQVDEGCGCNEGESIRCYPGPQETIGVGRCRQGFQVCRGGQLGACEASRLPIDELCNGTDDDCDGQIDEGVLNACGACGDLPAEVCDLTDNDCDGQIDEGVLNACGQCGLEPEEYCDSIDNDCDGDIDESCLCLDSVSESCYTGAPGTKGVGICRVGYWLCVGGQRNRCMNQITEQNEQCNGIDDDCDGLTDEALTNSCGECGVAPAESCAGPNGDFGNGLDDDCDGTIDEGCDCSGRSRQPCYSGLPKTLGKGLCMGGVSRCEDGQIVACENEVLPTDEVCGDGGDNDCDGQTDEGCPDALCTPSPEVCDAIDNDCDGNSDEGVRGPCGCRDENSVEICGNGFDDDCDGRVEEICGCVKGPPQPCYGGPPDTVGVGECRMGTFQCVPGKMLQQGELSGCRDWIGPQYEICNGRDDDCDGRTDENPSDGNACGTCGPPPVELCDGQDNDCDGLTDEGVSNACGQCGDLPQEVCDAQDNDCDGLIDEGTVNYCGTCGQSCFTQVFDDQVDWQNGSIVNLVAPDDAPNALTLGSTEVRGDSYLWAAAFRDREVVKIDTRTCEIADIHPSFGFSPSRTAVAVNGSVWIGNRGMHGGNAADYAHGNAVHLDVDGSLICRARITSGASSGGVAVRAAAIDQEGNAWLGSWSRRKIYRVSGVEVEPGDAVDGIPDCRILQEVDLPSPAYGAAIDSKGFLWTATSPTKIDTRDGEIVGRVPGQALAVGGPNDGEYISARFYGIAIDRNDNVWYAVTSPAGYLVRVDGKSHEMHAFFHGGGTTRGVAVDLDGNIWGGGGSLYKMSPEGEHLLTVPNAGAVGVAVDGENAIWAVGGSSAKRFNARTGLLECSVARLPSLYSYSDMTGMQLLNITMRSGRWSVKVDGGSDDVLWDRVDWAGAFPADAFVDTRVRTAPSRAGLTAATWSARAFETPMRIPGPNLESGYTPHNRWIEIEVRLTRQQDDVQPRLEQVRVHWQRP